MGKGCAVYGCKNSLPKDKGKGISFHTFPRDEILRSKWCSAVKRKGFQQYSVDQHVCSVHFKSTDFDASPLEKLLNKDAVPSIYTSGLASHHQAPEKKLRLQAHGEKPFSNVTITLPKSEERTYEITVTELPSSQPTDISMTSKDVEVTDEENDPLAIATCDEAPTTEQQHVEQNHDISKVKVKKANAVRRIIHRCGVCKYQAISEDDLKQHLFEEIRQLHVNKVSHLKSVVPNQTPLNDENNTAMEVDDSAVVDTAEQMTLATDEGFPIHVESAPTPPTPQSPSPPLARMPTPPATPKDKLPINRWGADKPPLSYAAMIGLVLDDLPDGRGTLNDLYRHVSENFPFYTRFNSAQWQKSIRKNLSLHPEFIRIKKDSGRGGLWTVKPGIDRAVLIRVKGEKAMDCDDVEEGEEADLHAGESMQPSNKDQKKDSSDIRVNNFVSGSKEAASCGECYYPAKNEEDLKNHLFQKHGVHKDQGKPINQLDNEEEHLGSNTPEKIVYSTKKDVPCCGVCNYQAKNDDDLRQHLFEEIRQQQANKSQVQKNQKDESHTKCSQFFIDMDLIQDGSIVTHCGCVTEVKSITY